MGATGPIGVTGPTGPTGPNEVYYGSGNPPALLGNTDAIYVNDQQGDVHFKQAGVWTLRGANAWYLQGKQLTAAVIAPSDGDILIYDQSLVGGVGGWKTGPNSASVSRITKTATTPSLAANASDSTTNIDGGKTAHALKISTDVPAWVRIYATAAARTADAARAIYSDPGANAACMLEVITTATLLTIVLSPIVVLASHEGTLSVNLPMTVKNLSGGTSTVTVTLTLIRLE